MLTIRTALTRTQAALSLLRLKSVDAATSEGRSRQRYRRIAMSSASSLIAKLVSTATLLVSIPLTLDYLGRERFGLWAALSTVIGFLALTDLGVGNALVNAVSRAMGKDDRTTARQAVSSGFFILAIQGVLLVIAFATLHQFVDWSRIFNLRSNVAAAEVGAAMAVLVVLTALQLPFGLVQRIQEGLQRSYLSNMWQAAASCAGLGGLLMVVHFRLGLPWLVAAVAGAPVVAMLANSAFEYGSRSSWLRPSLRFLNSAVSAQLVRSGFTFLVLGFLTFAGIYSDNFVISRMLSASSVAEYAVVQRLSLVAHLFWAFIIPLWPAYSEAHSRGDHDWVRKTFDRVLTGSIIAGAILGAGLAAFGGHIIAFWVGAELRVEPGLLYGFACYVVLSGLIGSISVFLNSAALLTTQLYLLTAAALVSVSLKIVLCLYYGPAGVIWATVIAFGLCYVLPGLWLTRRFMTAAPLVHRIG